MKNTKATNTQKNTIDKKEGLVMRAEDIKKVHNNISISVVGAVVKDNCDGLYEAINKGCPVYTAAKLAYNMAKINNVSDYTRVMIDYEGLRFTLDSAITFIASGSYIVSAATKAFANEHGLSTVTVDDFRQTYKKSACSINKGLACCEAVVTVPEYEAICSFKRHSGINDIKGIIVDTSGLYKLENMKEFDFKLNNAGRPIIPLNTGKLDRLFGNRTASAEQFLRTVLDTIHGTMLPSYEFKHTYAVNVLDSSASVFTADKRGIKECRLIRENMEYCTQEENSKHGAVMKKLWNKYGRVYRLSAHDPIVNTNPDDLTLEYLDKYYERVV